MRKIWIAVVAFVSLAFAQGGESTDEARARKVLEVIELNGLADSVSRWADWAPREQILDVVAAAYGQHFDDETLDAALAFFRSDAGKKYAAAEMRARLAAIAAVSLAGHVKVDDKGREGMKAQIADSKCKEYYDTVMTWRVMSDKKKFPASLEEMEAPIRAGEPDFTEVVLDPWGRKYVLHVEAGKATVLSFGPDGLEGTGDDITYPKR